MNKNDMDLFLQTPLLVLHLNTLKILGYFLNTQKILPSAKGFNRDWRGLAKIADLSLEEINQLQSDSNPTKEVILRWCKKTKKGTSERISVQDFFDCVINTLDRPDVYDETTAIGKLSIQM